MSPRAPAGHAVLVAALAALAACGPADTTGPTVALTEESGAALDQVPGVARFRLTGLAQLEVDSVWLVEGEVSAASLERLALGETPETVLNRRVELATWPDGDGLVLAPLRVLSPASSYTVLAPGLGELGRFTTTSAQPELWHRWGEGPLAARGSLVLCDAAPPFQVLERAEAGGASAPGESSGAGVELPDGLTLEPEGPTLEVALGFSGDGLPDGCLSLTVPQAGSGTFVLPTRVGGRALAPGLIELVGAEDEARDQADAAAEGIGLLEDGRVALSAGTYSLRLVDAGGTVRRQLLWSSASDADVSLGPLGELGGVSEGPLELRVLRVGALGERAEVSWGLPNSGPRGRVVISEVLADPRGAEPQSEWIELYNAGDGAASLAGMSIRDAAGGSELPAVDLAPGGYALVVREDFRASPGLDVVPDAEARRLDVAELGGSGLLNSGEALELVDASGHVVSRAPALAGDSGESIARRHPLWPDAEPSLAEAQPTAFARHAQPGASPGCANVLSIEADE